MYAFHKYHALGNIYLVLETHRSPSKAHIKKLCDTHHGVGADGILIWVNQRSSAAGKAYHLRIYNPDGSKAEKSGNGIRIFARYLHEIGHVKSDPFEIQTAGGSVYASVLADGTVTVEMGRVSFNSQEIPITGPEREAINEELSLTGCIFLYCGASLGNPHCVVLLPELEENIAHQYGALIENHHTFPQRTNVQFMRVIDRGNIQIEIWERGAGYTLSSGSSSCAAAAVARRLRLCDEHVTVHMPGGKVTVDVGAAYETTLHGPVTKICSGTTSEEFLDA